MPISYYILSCQLRYDYPDPGSEVDYVADNRVDYIKHYDGVAVAQFKKKVTTSKPFVRNVQNTRGKRLLSKMSVLHEGINQPFLF